jgi:ATP-dependent DNA helicase DinG
MLATMLPDDCPLIEQSPYQRAAVCAQAMREAAAHGERAVWLGVGAAWTGVDLSNASVPAKDDLVLTDLIIPRVPMGTNRTLSHLRRRAFRRDGFLLEAKECAMAFAQGIGRLVRREGVEHRRLWVLDARLGDRKLGYLSAIRNLLAEYRRR